jgi:hypothetical protein
MLKLFQEWGAGDNGKWWRDEFKYDVFDILTGGYIVIFKYELTIYLNLIYPLHHSLSSSPQLPFASENNLNRFNVFIYGYKTHPPYTLSFPFSLCPQPSQGYPLPKRFIFPPAIHFLKFSGYWLPWYFRSVYILFLTN